MVNLRKYRKRNSLRITQDGRHGRNMYKMNKNLYIRWAWLCLSVNVNTLVIRSKQLDVVT